MILQVGTLHPLRVAQAFNEGLIPTKPWARRNPMAIGICINSTGIPKKIEGKNVGKCSGNIHGASITLW